MAFQNVPARYMERRASSPAPAASPRREVFPSAGAFRHVRPRYDSPKRTSSPTMPTGQARPAEHWAGHADHTRLSRRQGFGAVHSRFFDHALDSPAEDSPRARVESNRPAETGR